MGVECLYRGASPGRPKGGDRPLCRACARGPSVARGATGPPCIFFARDLVTNLNKKITIRACRPMATGGSFEIFQNGNIFLKFCFF